MSQLSGASREEVEDPLEASSDMNPSTSQQHSRRKVPRASGDSSPDGNPDPAGRNGMFSTLMEQVQDALKKVDNERRDNTSLEEYVLRMTDFIGAMGNVKPSADKMSLSRVLVNNAMDCDKVKVESYFLSLCDRRAANSAP